MREVKSRGAKVLIVCPEALRDRAAKDADELWVIPDAASDLLPLLAIIPVQLFAYYMAVSRGCDVDKPRNLAKSVTGEQGDPEGAALEPARGSALHPRRGFDPHDTHFAIELSALAYFFRVLIDGNGIRKGDSELPSEPPF